jgi:hypothetical protein
MATGTRQEGSSLYLRPRQETSLAAPEQPEASLSVTEKVPVGQRCSTTRQCGPEKILRPLDQRRLQSACPEGRNGMSSIVRNKTMRQLQELSVISVLIVVTPFKQTEFSRTELNLRNSFIRTFLIPRHYLQVQK